MSPCPELCIHLCALPVVLEGRPAAGPPVEVNPFGGPAVRSVSSADDFAMRRARPGEEEERYRRALAQGVLGEDHAITSHCPLRWFFLWVNDWFLT